MKDIKHLKNITTKEQFLKHYEDIFNWAKTNIQYRFIEDVTQDSVIKILSYLEQGKTINGSFISKVIYNTFKDDYQHNKRYDMGGKDYEAVVPDSVDNFDSVYLDELEFNKKTDEIDNEMKKLNFYDKKLIEMTNVMNFSQFEKATGISRKSASKDRKRILDNIKSQLKK
jgi:DNA-directed RNA polymerase specialized sigma24 family protein